MRLLRILVLSVLVAALGCGSSSAADAPTTSSLTVPRGAIGETFGAPSCPTDNVCVAAGSYRDAHYARHGLIETLRGSRWRVDRVPLFGARPKHPVAFDGVSCSSSDACVALATRLDYSTDAPGGPPSDQLSVIWNGRRWRSVRPVTPTTGGSVDLGSVSCASPTQCIAVGVQGSGASSRAIAERWDGHRWHLAYLDPHPQGGSELTAVSCPSQRRCLAVGTTTIRAGRRISALHTLVLRRTAGRWSRLPSTTRRFSRLSDVSCVNASDCIIVGYSANHGYTPLAERFAGGGLTALPVPTGVNSLLSAACAPDGPCLLLGITHGGRDNPYQGQPTSLLATGTALVAAPDAPPGLSACRPTFCTTLHHPQSSWTSGRYELPTHN